MGFSRASVLLFTCGVACLPAFCRQPAASASKAIYQEALSDLQQAQPDAAIRILAPLIQSNPNDYNALTLMGMALAAGGKTQEAIGHFEKALAVRPAYPAALNGLAMSEMRLNRYQAAKAHFEALLRVVPQNPGAHAGLAEIAFTQGRFADAIRQFEESDPVYRQNPRLVIEYARANIQLKRTEKATTALANIPETSDAASHFEAGSLLASVKAYEAAARQFELALPDYSDKYAAAFNLILARVNAHQYPQAITQGEALVAAGCRKAELYNLMSEAYEASGNTRQAYDSLRTATQLEPLEESNYLDLITLCLNHKNYDLAAEIAGIGLKKLPQSERLHLQLGVVRAMQTRFDQAGEEFQQAAKLAPERSLPHVALALVAIQTNRANEAVDDLRRRVRKFPDDYLGLWFLAEALNRSGAAPGSAEEREAIDALRRSVRIDPNISQSQELLGKLLAREGQFTEAAEHLERAVKLQPDNVAALYQLAQVCSKNGQTARAKQLFAQVGKMKTDDRENFASHGLQQILRAGHE